MAYGKSQCLWLGNLNAERDWGHARDYVEAMWLMLQQDEPDDFVIATGRKHTVRDLVTRSFAELGITLSWEGQGVDEKGSDARSGRIVVEVDPRYFRPTEVELLLGDASKAKAKLGWEATTTFEDMISEMVLSDVDLIRREQGLRRPSEEPTSVAAQ